MGRNEENTFHNGFNHFPFEIHGDKPLKRLCGCVAEFIPTVETVGYGTIYASTKIVREPKKQVFVIPRESSTEESRSKYGT